MFYGFGLDVPYTRYGAAKVGHPIADNSGMCGDSFALQQMLSDLGFYTGLIDGQIGSGTMTSLRKFSEATGVPYVSGTFPKAATCQGLIDAWTRLKAPAASPPPATASATTTTRTSPYSLSTVSTASKIAAAMSTTTPRSGDTSGGTTTGWWGSQSNTVKYSIIGGALLAVGGVAYLAMHKKKVTPNRRRRARANIYGVTRAELEKQTKPLLEEAFKVDEYGTEEAIVAVTGASTFAWSRLTDKQLHQLRRILLIIATEGRGHATPNRRRTRMNAKAPAGPKSGFNRERTAADMRARIAWEKWAEKTARAQGRLADATGHNLAIIAYEERLSKFLTGAREVGRAIAQSRRSEGRSVRAHRNRKALGAWNVYLHGKHIDTVFYTGDMDSDEVKRSLVGHDGYDPSIVVKARHR